MSLFLLFNILWISFKTESFDPRVKLELWLDRFLENRIIEAWNSNLKDVGVSVANDSIVVILFLDRSTKLAFSDHCRAEWSVKAFAYHLHIYEFSLLNKVKYALHKHALCDPASQLVTLIRYEHLRLYVLHCLANYGASAFILYCAFSLTLSGFSEHKL